MISKFIIAGFFLNLCFETYAQHSLKYFQKSSVKSQCVFDSSEKTYDVTDLLRCIYELTADLFVQNDEQSSKEANNSSSLTYDPYNITLNVLKIISLHNDAVLRYRNLPLNPINGRYPSNYPNALNEPSGGFDRLGVNIFNALLSIYRHDDLKCVPRILCEVTSGNPPGEYKMASMAGNWSQLGINLLNHWIAMMVLDRPIMTFVQAASLGYSNSGNPSPCYDKFPKCPRNPDKLVHYLNNYNGGFFRFFSQSVHGSYPQSSYASRGNSKILGESKLKDPSSGIVRAKADRTGTAELKFDVPISTAREKYGRSFFPEENTSKSSGQIVFPDHDESDDHPSEQDL